MLPPYSPTSCKTLRNTAFDLLEVFDIDIPPHQDTNNSQGQECRRCYHHQFLRVTVGPVNSILVGEPTGYDS